MNRQDVLRVICEDGPFETLDDLISTARREGGDIGRANATNIVVSLGREKLVRYVERDGLPFGDIRAERNGYIAAGLPVMPRGGAVGHTQNLPSLHPGDPTDFRNQPRTTTGGPVTRSKTVWPGPRLHYTDPALVDVVVDALRRLGGTAETAAIAAAVGLHADTTRWRLEGAVTAGRVARAQNVRGRGKPVVWTLTDKPAPASPAPEPRDTRVVTPESYPALRTWMARAATLERLAREAADAGEEDIATMLRERLPAADAAVMRDVLVLIDDIGGI